VRQSIEKASGVEREITMTTLWHRRPHVAGAASQIKSLRSISLGRPEIERILKAVGARHVGEAVSYDALAAELRQAFREHVTRQELERDDPTERQVRTEIDRIMAWAKRFPTSGDRAARLLSEAMERKTQSRAREVWDPSGEQAWSLRKLQEGLAVCVSVAPGLLEREENLALAWRTPGEPTANYWLMGKLADIYTDFVGREPFGIARSGKRGGIPGGPGIRFVQEVLEIAGLKNRDGRPWGPEAIEEAWRQRARELWGK
jgi:hypothetical protein